MLFRLCQCRVHPPTTQFAFSLSPLTPICIVTTVTLDHYTMESLTLKAVDTSDRTQATQPNLRNSLNSANLTQLNPALTTQQNLCNHSCKTLQLRQLNITHAIQQDSCSVSPFPSPPPFLKLLTVYFHTHTFNSSKTALECVGP